MVLRAFGDYGLGLGFAGYALIESPHLVERKQVKKFAASPVYPTLRSRSRA